ncbi:hypothetical protein K1T71_014007 [Dendrolimus kikuchii]|uniref:Uncharacterized protein n=1 Tax=Dendrolimus kikuchii TaxID=765133 RepID=A0ACC1CGD7_9NEOP|nr:hypothetical protein K1T71_014007 [Dendrolimus kikuchii]
MALKFKYKDEHGILQINMSPTSSQKTEDLIDPKFDTINTRFGQYDLFGGKYDDLESGGETPRSLFRSRYNSVEEELANTPYAFATRSPNLDITINNIDSSSRESDIEDNRFFTRNIDYDFSDVESKSFTVTQLIHAQDRYFDLSSRTGSTDVKVPSDCDGAFRVLGSVHSVKPKGLPVVPTAKRKRESSFAILTDTPVASRPSSPRSLPVYIRREKISPFRGRGFREETSRHTPKTSATNSRSNSPTRRRTHSLPRIDKMATATLPPPIQLIAPNSPRNFLKENIEEVRGLSELNREKHEAEAEKKRLEEEEALLKEMGLLDKKPKSRAASRSTSRSNSPNKINLRSRSNSPSTILRFENISSGSRDYINEENMKPVTHKSRLQSVSRSQPQSNDSSPKHSKIPKRQSSVSPSRGRLDSKSKSSESLNKTQRFISNSNSSIHETIKIGSQVHDKRGMSKSTQHLDISPGHIMGKPPISPGRGPPPVNKTLSAKRLSPIVGTPNKNPTDEILSPKTAKPIPAARKNVKSTGNTPATSRLNSKPASRDPSPEKRKGTVANTSKTTNAATRTSSMKSKPTVSNKTDPKTPIKRTNSVKSLTRTPSTKILNEKPPLLKNANSRKDLTEKIPAFTKITEVGKKSTYKDIRKPIKGREPIIPKKGKAKKDDAPKKDTNDTSEEKKQDDGTQYDISNLPTELVLMTKKNIVSMAAAAITSQPLEIVAKVTSQLPVAFEKAREKGIFERLNSRDSLAPKEDEKDKEKENGKDKEKEKEKIKPKEPPKVETKEIPKEKEIKEINEIKEEKEHAKPQKPNLDRTFFIEDNIKLRPLQPPYNNPYVERVKQKIDNILKEPEVSTENILTASAKSREAKFKAEAEKSKEDVKEIKEVIAVKEEVTTKITEVKDNTVKENDKVTSEIRSEATKIVNSIITPVEEPKDITEQPPSKIAEEKKESKKEIEPIVTVVNEKKKIGTPEVVEKNETVIGEPEVEVQSSNVSTPAVDKIVLHTKATEGSGSDKSTQSNGGFPQSTSTTPKPPARTKRDPKEKRQSDAEPTPEPKEQVEESKPQNICQRLVGKCKTCCSGGAKEDEDRIGEEKKGVVNSLNCCKKGNEREEEIERAASKASVEFENEVKRKPKMRDILCGCCGRGRRVADASQTQQTEPMSPMSTGETGCCGRRRQVGRRDSILSDRPPSSCCNNRLCTWLRGMCRRSSEHSSSRRTSMFSKNKSLSPTMPPPEDNRKKLDTSLVEHTSVMRGAIPVLPIALAYICMMCNILVPGLGTIFSGMFCLCFGIPRFGVHDGAKHRIGSFVINLLVGCGQLFTVLFCLVGWGWSIWWGVIMVKIARKFRKLKAEAAAAEPEAPPVTTNNHTRA